MNHPCDDLAAALAAGQPLGDAQRNHADQCEACAGLLELPDRIHAATGWRSTVEPGPGFVARVTRGAVEARTRHRRRRVVAGLAVAAGAVAVVLGLTMLRPSGEAEPSPRPAAIVLGANPEVIDLEPAELLLDLSNLEGALSFQADWDAIEEPLAGVRLLAEQGDGR